MIHCQYCGLLFTPTAGPMADKQRFCCTKHRKAAHRHARDASLSRVPVTRPTDLDDGTRDGTRPTPLPPTPPHPTVGGGVINARAREAGAATSADGARGAHSDPWAIANCDLCDDDGRKPNGMVCDHIDRRFTAAHGSKQIREQMGWKT